MESQLPDHVSVYQVGGSVRDYLLFGPECCYDHDYVVVGATKEDMLNAGFKQVGKSFPVFLHPETNDEWALARTEQTNGPGYHDFQTEFGPHVSLEEDLARRDLTINAIAIDSQGTIIDPYNGREDLKEGVLRHIQDAFSEDPVRVLRTARFAARFGFSVAAETISLAKSMAHHGYLDHLIPERVGEEVRKALETARPHLFFHTLHQMGALNPVIPEVYDLFGVLQKAEHHPEVDAGIHTLMVLDQCSQLTDDPVTRFAALVHDLGKAVTPPSEWPSHVDHENNGVDKVQDLCERIRMPTRFRQAGKIASRYHLKVHRAFDMRPGSVVDLFDNLGAFKNPYHLQLLLHIGEADARGRLGLENRHYPQPQYLWECYEQAVSVTSQEALDKGLSGPDVGEFMRQQRCQLVAEVKARWKDQY